MTKRLFSLVFALLLWIGCCVHVSAAGLSRLDDGADLLRPSEETRLLEQLDRISEEYQADVIVVTVDSVGYGSVDRYIEELYDNSGYGYGPARDGVMLLVAMAEREYRILSNGFGAEAVTMAEIDAIGEDIAGLLSGGEYAAAFETFADRCAYQLDGERNGFPFPLGQNLLICLAVGLAAGLIATGVMALQLRSVRNRNTAGEYVKEGSMRVTEAGDLYLYRTVDRRRRQQSSSSGSRSGGGGSRNVGGGRF